MKMNREQGLFLAALVVAGGWMYLRHSDRYVKTRVPTSQAPETPAAPFVPEIQFPAGADPAFDPAGRDPFLPPRDWNPLPLLLLETPPLPEIGAVGLLPDPGVESRYLAIYRQPPYVVRNVEPPSGGGGDPANGGGAGGAGRFAGIDFGADIVGSNGVVADDVVLEKTYDWIKRKSLNRIWGFVRNDDKFGLLDDSGAAIEFQQVNTKTGKATATAVFQRGDLEGGGVFEQGFGFADTVHARVVLERRRVSPSGTNLQSQLEAARNCLGWVDEDRETALEGAEGFIRSVLSYNKQQTEAWELLAEARERAFDTEGELKVYDDAAAAGVKSSRLDTRRAERLAELGLSERAEHVLRKAVKDNPSDLHALHALGRLLIERDRAAEAVPLLDKAQGMAANATERIAIRLDLVRAYLRSNQLSEASARIDQVMRMGIESADAYNLKGVVHLAAGDTSSAIRELRAALEIDPRNRDAVYNLGVAMATDPDDELLVEQARARFQQATDVDPLTFFDSTLALGALEESLGNLEQAMFEFDTALEFHPGRALGLYRKGRVARRQGDVDTAKSLLREALHKDGRIIDVLNELGSSELLDDQPEAAELYLRESLRREPSHREIYVLLGASLLRQNQMRAARETFVDGIGDAESPNAAALCGIAWCDYRLGDVESAVEKFAEARAAATEGDPFHVYADTNQARIEDHRIKEQWIDRFDRRQIKNGWDVKEPFGPQFQATGDGLTIAGLQRRTDPDEMSELTRSMEGATFVRIEAVLEVPADNEATVGLRFVHHKVAGRTQLPAGEVAVARFPDGTVHLFVREDANSVSQDWVELEGATITKNEPFRFTIERTNYDKGLFDVKLGDQVIAKDVASGSLKKMKRTVDGGVFVTAGGNKKVNVTVSEVRVVRDKP